MKKPHMLAAGSLLALCIAAGLALGRPDRGFRAPLKRYVDVFGPMASGTLILTPLDTLINYYVPYPMERGGAATDFANYTVILAGRDESTDKGVLVKYARDTTGANMVQVDRYEWPAGDGIGLTYDSMNGVLYLLDANFAEIRAANYNPMGGLPANWTTIATSLQVPLLGAATLNDYSLYYVADRTSLLLVHSKNWYSEKFAWIDVTPGGSVTERDGIDTWPSLVETDVLEGATMLAVEGPPGASVDLVKSIPNGAWGTIGMVTLNASGTANVSVPPLGLGEILGVKKQGLSVPTPPFLPSIQRHGVPSRLDAGSILRPLSRYMGLSSFVGNSRFSVDLLIDHDDVLQVVYPATYLVALCAIGVPADVQYVGNGQAFLDTPTAIAASVPVSVWSPDEAGYGEAALPIPNDQQLAGEPLCFQWWILTSTTLALSDIVCVKIAAHEFVPPDYALLLEPPSTTGGGPLARFSAPGGSGRGERLNRDQLLERLLQGHKDRIPVATVKAVLELIRKR